MKLISTDLQNLSVVVGGKQRRQTVAGYLQFNVGCV
jgi:hypothetical protein